LAKSFVSTREFAEAASGKDGWIGGLEVLVNDQPAVVDQAIVVNGREDILIYISVTSRDEDPTFNLELVLLPLLPLLDKVSLLVSVVVDLAAIFTGPSGTILVHV